MSPPAKALAYSLSGDHLAGSRLVRLTFFDDCGLFNPKQEPLIIVGGVLVDADRQLVAVENHLNRLAFKYFPDRNPEDVVFHAKDIWHGGGDFPREQWPRERRLSVLADLVAIPKQFDLLVTYGYQRREFIPRYNFPETMSDKDKELAVYSDVVARFCETVERFMRECAPDEITIIIAEDRDSIKNLLKEAHILYRNHARMMKINPLLTYFPFTHIRDALHFAGKKESKHLQIADTCTFVFKRHMTGDATIEPYYEELKHQMLVLPNGETLEEPS